MVNRKMVNSKWYMVNKLSIMHYLVECRKSKDRFAQSLITYNYKKHIRLSTFDYINYQLSIVNCQLSIMHSIRMVSPPWKGGEGVVD